MQYLVILCNVYMIRPNPEEHQLPPDDDDNDEENLSDDGLEVDEEPDEVHE